MPDTHLREPRTIEKIEIVAPKSVPAEPLRGEASIAFRILQVGFIAIPLLAGLDKFFHLLVNWERYLAPAVEARLPVSATTFMGAVGVVEIAAAFVVAVAPAIGGFVVAVWLWGIVVNLLVGPGFLDVAVRDVGLSLGALALGFLALARRRHESRPVA